MKNNDINIKRYQFSDVIKTAFCILLLVAVFALSFMDEESRNALLAVAIIIGMPCVVFSVVFIASYIEEKCKASN